MKRARGVEVLRVSDFEEGEDETPFGLLLRASAVAEHEYGLGGMRAELAVGEPTIWLKEKAGAEELYGLWRRHVTRVRDNQVARWHSSRRDAAALQFYAYGLTESPEIRRAFSYKDEPLAAAWTDRGFEIVAEEEEGEAILDLLYERLMALDLAVFAGQVPPRHESGLWLVVPSRAPEALHRHLAACDIDADRLRRAARETGVMAALNAAGRGYFACEPAWADEDRTRVKFFLNPQNQKRNASGWFSPKELHQWARGEGPVIERKARTR